MNKEVIVDKIADEIEDVYLHTDGAFDFEKVASWHVKEQIKLLNQIVGNLKSIIDMGILPSQEKNNYHDGYHSCFNDLSRDIKDIVKELEVK